MFMNMMASVSGPLGQVWRSWWGEEACGLGASVMRPRLFRKARDPDAWQWAGGWHAPWGPPQAYFHLQALWAGAVWVFLWKRRFLGPCRWLAGSRLATVVMPGGFCQPLFRAVCQAAGGTGQPSRSGDPLVSGAPCCGGPWQGPKAPVPPALRQRGPGGAPSWPGAAAVRRTLPSRPPASGLLVEILLALHPEFSFSRATEGSHRPERPSAGPHGGAACSPRRGAPFSVCRGDLRLEAAGPPREETRPPSCQNCSLCPAAD